jgi:hypothetical protein
MGSKLMSIDDIRFSSSIDADNDTNIVFNDLVRTLKIDPTKYNKPVVNEHDEIILNEIYVQAAREAKITHLIVDGPWKTHYFQQGTSSDINQGTQYLPSKTKLQEILKNHIFFENDVRNQIENHPVLNDLFEQYHQHCKKLIETGSVINRGKIQTTEFKFQDKDMLTYALMGELVSPENKSILTTPTESLYKNLNTIVGPIRSINGIKYHPSK